MATKDVPAVVTDEPKKEADKVSGPYIKDAEGHDPPLRTNHPDQPVATVLASGAGAHEPPDDPHIGADGRFYKDTADAQATSATWPAREAPNAPATTAADERPK